MRIGLDIDDTLTETKKTFSKYIKKYRHAHKIKKYNENKQLSEEDFKKFLQECGEEAYKKIKPKKDAAKIIREWVEEGHTIYFITARSELDCKSIESITKKCFAAYDIPYEKIIFGSQNKAEDAQNLDLDVFVDDRESMLDTFKNTNVFPIRFMENKKNYSKYKKVSNWKELNQVLETL